MWLHLQFDRVRDVHAQEPGDGFARLAGATKSKIWDKRGNRKEREGAVEEGQGGREGERETGREHESGFKTRQHNSRV